jgi:hypothetical protein
MEKLGRPISVPGSSHSAGMLTLLDVLFATLVLVAGIPLIKRFEATLKPLPPGPSLLDRLWARKNNEKLGVKYLRWSKRYGKIEYAFSCFDNRRVMVRRRSDDNNGYDTIRNANAK